MQDKQRSVKQPMIQNTLHDIRVITFNLLSGDVVSKESIAQLYPKIQKKHMDFANRVEKTKKLMLSWMKVNFIICVQEMSREWQDQLAYFFAENGYGFYSEVYSDGKMGVGISFPLRHYDILDTDRFMCGTFIKPIYEGIKTDESKVSDPLALELEYGSESKNILISVLLSSKHFGKTIGKNLVVSTFHMPCRYKYKYFMCSHIHALKVHLSVLMTKWNNVHGNTVSAILCGDFNITPKSPEYKYLTGQEYSTDELRESDNSAHFITNLMELYQHVGQDLFAGMRFRSTHMTLHGKEPEYTNVMIQKDRSFVECLDYILINDQIDVRSCTVGLSVDDPIASPYPNGLCPSDHLPLSASLRIR